MAKFWDIEREREVSVYDVIAAWEELKANEQYDGSFAHFLNDECLGKNGSLITWEEHERREAKQAADEAAAAIDFGEAETVTLKSETRCQVAEGDVLFCRETGTAYLVRTVIEYVAYNRKCYAYTITDTKYGRTLYAYPSSSLYGLEIVKR